MPALQLLFLRLLVKSPSYMSIAVHPCILVGYEEIPIPFLPPTACSVSAPFPGSPQISKLLRGGDDSNDARCTGLVPAPQPLRYARVIAQSPMERYMLWLILHGCPCGFFSDPKKECTCSSSAVARYQKRVSGPVLDPINVFVEIPPVEYEKLVDEAPAQDSSHARQRVEQANPPAGFSRT